MRTLDGVLVLALDTATDAVVVGLVSLPENTVLAERVHPGARRHGEQLMPAVLDVCVAAGHELAELDAVVCGAGPGPFTGLRVGLISAAGLGDALGVPVYGVCSLDALATEPTAGEPLLVVSDARRREVYWAAYDAAGNRVAGPAVGSPAAVADRAAELGVRRVVGPLAETLAEPLGLPAWPGQPTPLGLVGAAGAALAERRVPAPLEPIYLRRPDAVPPGERKRAMPAEEVARVTSSVAERERTRLGVDVG